MFASDFSILLPEIILSVYAMAALMAAVYTSKDGLASVLVWTTAAAFVFVAALIGLSGGSGTHEAFGGMFIDDGFSRFAKVVILLSDGENNVPDITPADAARLAKDAGVRVHCIGIGAGQVFNDLIFGRRVIKPEFKSLKSIAKICEGEFFEATTATELTRVYDRINELEKVELEDPRFKTVDLYRYPFALGAALLLLQLLLELLWIRRVP